MFNSLSDRLTATFKNLRGKGRLSEADVDATVRWARAAGYRRVATVGFSMGGAVVLRHARNRGKAAAMQSGANAVGLVDQRESRERPRHLLFLDADLGESAVHAGPLAAPVLAGQADMTIAVFAATVKLGGHGLVVGLSGAGIRRAVGWQPAQPLNGQRCLTRAAFEAARPLARGWGVETALTIDLLRQGFRVTEVEVELAHRATGTGLRAQLHRAHQLADVARALAARR